MIYKIWVDGGSLRNGSPDQVAYGSSVSTCVGDARSTRKEYAFGCYSNNAAEYLVLIAVLINLVAATNGFLRSGDCAIIYTDSLRVANQVNCKEKSKKLKPYLDQVSDLLNELGSHGIAVNVVKVGRDEIVQQVGH